MRRQRVPPQYSPRGGRAEPVAITDCLNFGSPEDIDAMWRW